VDEQPQHDGRRRKQDVVDESREARDPAVAAVFRKVDAGQDADRRRDKRCDTHDERAADDRIGEAPRRAGRGRRRQEQRRRNRADTLGEEHDENPDQERHAERHCGKRHEKVAPVDPQSPAINERSRAVRHDHVERPSPRASCAMRSREQASTMNVSTNRTSPSEMSEARWTGSAASLNSLASAEAIELPGLKSAALIRYALPITNVTAIVSPSARPRPSMIPPITPTLVYGSTMFQTTSHGVAPRAEAA